MAARISTRRRIATAARWPVGIVFTSWRYLWRTTPWKRSETAGDETADRPPALPPDADPTELQGPEHGVGPLYHRRYAVKIRGATLSARELIGLFQCDPDIFAPSEFASFQTSDGHDGRRLRVGDELVVRMPGPWDGPVRVVELDPDSFRLVTLRGHLEAGTIRFSCSEDEDEDALIAVIESWARSGDRFSDLLYSHLRMAKEIQLHMWTCVLEHMIRRSGGRRAGPLTIETRRVDDPDYAIERLEPRTRRRKALAALAGARPNLDLSRRDLLTEEHGWRVDHRIQPLASEAPGPPEPGGTFEIAKKLMRGYEFADPSIVRATYDPDVPLAERSMLLELRFWGLRFWVGTRVTGEYEGPETFGGREAYVYGWSYATLEGHLEAGEMSWEVRKWLDTGEVEFRLAAASRAAEQSLRNPIVRLGLRLFGRREQLRFYDSTCRRMVRLTEAALHEGREAVREVAATETARPGRGPREAAEALADHAAS